jgi:hypothetical protein
MKDAVIAVVLGAVVFAAVVGFDTLGERRPRARRVAVLGGYVCGVGGAIFIGDVADKPLFALVGIALVVLAWRLVGPSAEEV